MSACRRPVRACLAGVLVALSAVGCASRAGLPAGSAPTSSADAVGVIPWVHAATSAPTQSPPTPPAPRSTDARPCTGVDVTERVDGPNGAGGHEIHYVWLRNVSTSTCVLLGYPRVTATGAGLPDVTGTDGSFFPTDGPANMAPGQESLLGLETDSYCAAHPDGGGDGQLYHRVDVALTGGGRVLVAVKDGLDLKCGLRLTPFSVPRPAPPRPPVTTLQVSLRLPASVQPGAVLGYVVELTNPTSGPVALTPCPTYVQAASAPATDTETLNCAPLDGTLVAHATARFEMRMLVPRATPAGPMTLKWFLLAPDFLGGAQGSVDVVAR